ncbi:unnamed protein product [Protopolystoma xenopodis]|uniref:Uncharacterized protein n=1 Tax=Protopolystoma xenopodis TaxID=117903 RepID=A0A3S5AEK5_9PLAT|nr:unnamed protein product [Protopolystoma xenopodis]
MLEQTTNGDRVFDQGTLLKEAWAPRLTRGDSIPQFVQHSRPQEAGSRWYHAGPRHKAGVIPPQNVDRWGTVGSAVINLATVRSKAFQLES